MKHTILNKLGLGYMLVLILAASCTKDWVPQPVCNPCKTLNAQTFNNVAVNNWLSLGNGSYKSDLNEVMKNYSQSYSSIYQIELVSEPSRIDLQPGSDTQFGFGKLVFTGSYMVYTSDSHFGEHGLPPMVSSLHLNVTVIN
ncbi:MAG: hypothetical protein ACHQET_14325 [Chitinophagales bacterium]